MGLPWKQMRVVSSDLHCFIVSTILDVRVGWSGLSELCPIWKTLFYTKLPRPHLCGGGKMEPGKRTDFNLW